MKKEKKEGRTVLIIIIVLFTATFFWVFFGFKKTRNEEEWLLRNGVRTIACFENTSGKYGYYYDYGFKVNGIKYECSTIYNFMKNKNFPLVEIPILVAYDPNDPDRNIALINEEFTYNGYKILYKLVKPNESSRAYMEFQKIEK